MTQKMPDMCPIATGVGRKPSILDERAGHEGKSTGSVLGRYLVTSLARSREYNTHVIVDEDEVILVAAHLVHDVVDADISMQYPGFVPQVMEACGWGKISVRVAKEA